MSLHPRPPRPSFLALAALLVLATAACEEPPPPVAPPSSPRYFGQRPDGKLHIYFFDVGQGDSALIVSPEGHTVLVDTGPAGATDHLRNRLPELLAQKLDLVVLTHPAPDHHGALEGLLGRVGAQKLLEPQLPNPPDDYGALLNSVGQRGVEILSPAPPPSTPNAMYRRALGAGVELTVLWPRPSAEKLLDVPLAPHAANSIILRLTYGETAVLFMGDARVQTEAHLLEQAVPVKATLLKVAAHGSAEASSQAFLEAVAPRAALISVGAGNSLNAPSDVTLGRLKAMGARVFRTDVDGEVQVVSDGRQLVITPQRLPSGAPEDTRYTFPGLNAPVATATTETPPTNTGPGTTTTSPPPVKPSSTPERTPATASRPGVTPQAVDIDDLPAANPPPRPPRDEPPFNPKATKVRQVPDGQYVASRNSDKFHLPSCTGAHRIHDKNLVVYKTRAAALADHKRPADDCKP